MIPVPLFPNELVAVVGLARSGLSSARSLKAGGAKVIVWDDGERGRAAAEGEFDIVAPEKWNWDKLKAIVLSPGIPLTHPKPHPIVVEAMSVIVQVASFKLTGKRVFRMAPIHHHYEKKGWAEPTIVIRFWIVSVILALIGLSTLKLR